MLAGRLIRQDKPGMDKVWEFVFRGIRWSSALSTFTRLKQLLLYSLLFIGSFCYAQRTFEQLYNHPEFKWHIDSTNTEVAIYYLAESWAHQHIELVKERVLHHFYATLAFCNLDSYPHQIRLFLVSSRKEMGILVGNQTNGTAYYQYHTVTAIASTTTRSVFSNHELFHEIAMNQWGVPAIWINEAMAVYSDNNWQGMDLHQLAKYLLDNNRVVPLAKLVNSFKKVDNKISYPQAGSFIKFLDETYGRDPVLKLWQTKGNRFRQILGKSLNQLEDEWIGMLSQVSYQNISY